MSSSTAQGPCCGPAGTAKRGHRTEDRRSAVSEARSTILVVDDDRDYLTMMAMILEPEGYRVVTAENGREALEKARLASPDLILLDVMMPEVDGFATCGQLKSAPESREIPVILLTGVAKQVTKSEYPKDGMLRVEAEDYLEKPIDPDQLLKIVAGYLKS